MLNYTVHLNWESTDRQCEEIRRVDHPNRGSNKARAENLGNEILTRVHAHDSSPRSEVVEYWRYFVPRRIDVLTFEGRVENQAVANSFQGVEVREIVVRPS